MAPAVGIGRAVGRAREVRGIKLRHRRGGWLRRQLGGSGARRGCRLVCRRWHSSGVVVAVGAALGARVATEVAVVEAAEVEAGRKGSYVTAGQTAGRVMAVRW